MSVVFRWLPTGPPRAVVHVLHGWGEHARRYDRLADELTAAGYAVYADDHRGHGQTGVGNGTLGDVGPQGMEGVLDAVHAVSRQAAAEHPDRPVFALGHSWGSMILQRYLRRWSGELAGALLTGTTWRDPAVPAAERPAFNAGFEPARTPYDWLTRDEAEVDRYVADPLCGFEMMRSSPTAASAASATRTRARTRAGARDAAATSARPTVPTPIRADLPILVFNGADDPVGGERGGRALAEHYRSLGVDDVTFIAYPGARHELFNELNRDEVVADVLAWLDARAPVRSTGG